MKRKINSQRMTLAKRWEAGISLIETIIVLTLTIALYDVINFAIFKAQQLNLEKDKAVYLVEIRDDIAAYLQQQRQKPTIQEGAVEVALKDIMSPLHYNNLPQKYVKVTHVLIKKETLPTNPDIAFLSALVFTEKDPKQTALDTARINTLVGPIAGQLSVTDKNTITNGRHSFYTSKSAWDANLTKKLDIASNVLYIPSTLVNMVQKPAKEPGVTIDKFTLTEGAIAHSCDTNHQCNWYPAYTSDNVTIDFKKKGTSTDHVKVELISLSRKDINRVFYASTFFNNQIIKILPDVDWYDHRLQLKVTPYDIDGNAGGANSYVFQVSNPNEKHLNLPFNIVYKFLTFDIDKNNQKTSTASGDKLLITGFLETNNKNSTDNTIYSFLKPVTIVASTQLCVDASCNTPIGEEEVLVKQVVTDTVPDIFFQDQTDFDKLIADENRYPFKYTYSRAGNYFVQPRLRLFWGNNVLREKTAPIVLGKNLKSKVRIAININDSN